MAFSHKYLSVIVLAAFFQVSPMTSAMRWIKPVSEPLPVSSPMMNAQSAELTCANDRIEISLPKTSLLAISKLYRLRDSKCKPKSTRHSLTFSFGVNECGTVTKSNETHWLISNTVSNTDFHFPPKAKSILHYRHQKITFHCVYPRTMHAEASKFATKTLDYEYPISGESSTVVHMKLFTDKALTMHVSQSQQLKLNSPLYATVSRPHGDSSTFIVPIKCWASASADVTVVQPLLHDGCWVSDRFKYINHTKDTFEFTFPTFGFMAAGNKVNLECIISTCRIGSTHKACQIPVKTCESHQQGVYHLGSARKIVRREDIENRKRDLQSEGIDFTKQSTQFSVEPESPELFKRSFNHPNEHRDWFDSDFMF